MGRNPDGTRQVVVIDNGAVGRLSHTRYATKGSAGAPTVYGPLTDPESDRPRLPDPAKEKA